MQGVSFGTAAGIGATITPNNAEADSGVKGLECEVNCFLKTKLRVKHALPNEARKVKFNHADGT